MTPELRKELLEWMRERAPVHELMRRFPPACKVQANVSLAVPRPGEVGIVVSYGEPGPDTPDGWLGVVSPNGILPDVRAQCTPEQLEVIGYDRVTPEEVSELLAELKSATDSVSDAKEKNDG